VASPFALERLKGVIKQECPVLRWSPHRQIGRGSTPLIAPTSVPTLGKFDIPQLRGKGVLNGLLVEPRRDQLGFGNDWPALAPDAADRGSWVHGEDTTSSKRQANCIRAPWRPHWRLSSRARSRRGVSTKPRALKWLPPARLRALQCPLLHNQLLVGAGQSHGRSYSAVPLQCDFGNSSNSGRRTSS